MTQRILLSATLLFGVYALAACSSNSTGTSTDAIVGGGDHDASETDLGSTNNDDSGSTAVDSGDNGQDAGGGSVDSGTAGQDTGTTGDHDAGMTGGHDSGTTGDHDSGMTGGNDAGMTGGNDAGMTGGNDAGMSGHNIQTVFVILMENKNWADINGSSSAPFMNSLLAMGAHAEDYHGDVHPSEPNYIWMAAGDNLGITSDNDPPHSVGGSGNHSTTTENLGTQLNTAGVTWKAYEENISGTVCPLQSAEPSSGPAVGHGYRPKHDPFVFFDNLTGGFNPMNADCIAHNRPFTELATDLQNNTVARFNFITPNLCDDMHDTCAPQNNDVKQGDDFAASVIPMIMQSQAYQNGGVIFLLWDESTFNSNCISINPDCPVGMIILSPFAKTNYSNMTHYDHSSLLRTWEDIFGITTHLRAAANATNLSDFFTAFP